MRNLNPENFKLTTTGGRIGISATVPTMEYVPSLTVSVRLAIVSTITSSPDLGGKGSMSTAITVAIGVVVLHSWNG